MKRGRRPSFEKEGEIFEFTVPSFYLSCWKGEHMLVCIAGRNPLKPSDPTYTLLAIEGSIAAAKAVLENHSHLEIGTAPSRAAALLKCRRFMRRWIANRGARPLCECGPIAMSVSKRKIRAHFAKVAEFEPRQTNAPTSPGGESGGARTTARTQLPGRALSTPGSKHAGARSSSDRKGPARC